jgi:hypothetical protein
LFVRVSVAAAASSLFLIRRTLILAAVVRSPRFGVIPGAGERTDKFMDPLVESS